MFTLKEMEQQTTEQEKRLIERLKNLKLSQQKAQMFEGIRNENKDFTQLIEQTQNELDSFVIKNAHLLI